MEKQCGLRNYFGLNSNASRGGVLAFSKSVADVTCVKLGNQSFQLSACIKYLGLPIGDSVKNYKGSPYLSSK